MSYKMTTFFLKTFDKMDISLTVKTCQVNKINTYQPKTKRKICFENVVEKYLDI